MSKSLAAITHTQSIELYFSLCFNFEDLTEAICICGQDPHVAAEQCQAGAQAVSGAYCSAIRLCRIKGRTYMQHLHTTQGSARVFFKSNDIIHQLFRMF